MNPVLSAGDLVLVHKGARVDVRDVVLYQESGHSPVLHRMIGHEGADAIRTKGDAYPTADRDAVPVAAVVGPVLAVLPVGSFLAWWRAR
jgi:signal peptidase I